MDITTVRRKLDNTILEISRKVYWMEQEFWDAIHGDNDINDLEEMFYNRIVREVKRNVSKEFPYLELKL